MKISFKILSEFVAMDEFFKKPQALADALTRAGLEVETIEDGRKDFQNLTVGLILDKKQHPQADKLTLCQVTTGDGVVHQVVCGARNHSANDKVVIALPGANLPGDLKIQTSVIRGVESSGMLCSLKELGLAQESDGILILPGDAPVGKPFAEYYDLDDVVFELKVTPNRADCLSHFGLAREIACLTGAALKKPQPLLPQSGESTKERVQLAVENAEACPRYCGRFIKGVKVAASPIWLKRRLESLGLKSINNVVDATNYVMMELGQPMHAFDSEHILGHKIVVGMSRAQEPFHTLDGTALTLTGEELVIRDDERVVALAGVVGGKNSGVSEKTTDIFLESAYFLPSSVRRTSRRFGLVTDSAYRFSRGVDPEGCHWAMDCATELILQLAGGEAFGDVHDVYPSPVQQKAIQVSPQLISDRLGFICDAKLLQEWMKRLGCEVVTAETGEFTISPPTFRFDLEHPMDVVEEYARLTGYEQIPDHFPALRKEPAAQDQAWVVQEEFSKILRGAGYSQAMNFAFTNQKVETEFIANTTNLGLCGFQWGGTSVKIINPLSDDINVMRRILTYSLFRNCVHNFHQGQEQGALFELGPCFDMIEDSGARKYREEQRVAAIAWGEPESIWTTRRPGSHVFQLKAVIEALGERFGSPITIEQPENRGQIPSFLHRGRAGWVTVQGQRIGFFGEVHPALLQEEKIRVPVVVFELSMKAFVQYKSALQAYKPFSRLPSVRRDMSLMMSQSMPVASVIAAIKESGSELVRAVEVFDIYTGDEVPKGSRAVALRVWFQDPNVTLQDSIVQEKMQAILDSLKQKWGLTPR